MLFPVSFSEIMIITTSGNNLQRSQTDKLIRGVIFTYTLVYNSKVYFATRGVALCWLSERIQVKGFEFTFQTLNLHLYLPALESLLKKKKVTCYTLLITFLKIDVLRYVINHQRK